MLSTNKDSITGSSPRQSTFSAEQRTFSQADTVQTSRNHAANTGERARHSWGNSLINLWRMHSFMSDESNRPTMQRPSGIAENTVDGAVSLKSAASSTAPVIELPASPVAGPDAPRSFFDSDSESDGEPILSRASSVRVQRPQLVEHNTNAIGRSLHASNMSLAPFVYPVPSGETTKQDLGSPLNAPDDLSRPGQHRNLNDTNQDRSIRKAQNILGTRLQTLSDPTSAVKDESPIESAGGGAEALDALTTNVLDRGSLIAIAPNRSLESDRSSMRNSIIKPRNPTTVQALGTLPPPIAGLNTIQRPHPHVLESRTVDNHPGGGFSHQSKPGGGHRSNLARDADISILHRAISAPPLPFRSPSRKIAVQTLDPEAAGTNTLRQSVVCTPHPTRAASLMVDAISPLSAVASTKLGEALQTTSHERDRFPSPPRPEVLYLEFAVARRPSMPLLVQVKIEDRSTYDDEALFKVLQKSYKETLLGMAQYLATARALRSVTCVEPGFDAVSFLRHLRFSRAGHKRKTWLMRLREHQVTPNTKSSNGSEHRVSFFSPRGTPRMPFLKTHTVHPRLTFHFEFSLARVALAILWIIIMSALAAILWVLFGVPGFGAAHGRHDRAMPREKWQADAQSRVLTGLVLGVFVALLGTLGGAGWMGVSWLSL